ncbi:MAG TPA: PCYCGC motif-containing (lipo)protein [Bacilli bacterium]|nr:PCYCGC motif-containing (lipo)protein [Bacilli bacterium]
MKPIKPMLITGLSALFLLSGCASSNSQSTPADTDSHSHSDMNMQQPAQLAANQTIMQNGDLRETTSAANEMPQFLMTKTQEIQQVYAIAAKHLDVLQYIPCYCGCGEHAGHKSNAECFIHETKDDGTIQWDDHGTRCNTCMEIAVTASKMSDEGKSTKEIRTYIDEHYKEGYAKPTPTPMPF